jgi:hypothetical protein
MKLYVEFPLDSLSALIQSKQAAKVDSKTLSAAHIANEYPTDSENSNPQLISILGRS